MKQTRNELGRDDFDKFFAELHDGRDPFAWQQRLLDTVLDRGWPAALVAPTGSGKTAVIDVHVFALAIAVATGVPLPPRRMALIVDRRVLVDDQYRYADVIAARLAADDASSIMATVAGLLWQLQGDPVPSDGPLTRDSPLLVRRLRGGMPVSRRWVDHPTAAAVLCATPDMFGSRLLFRGYGSSPRAWPREAGLLAVDTVAVVDEAHLARQLLRTARRVGELMPVADRAWDGPPPLRVVETTATPHATSSPALDHLTGDRVDVDDGDLADSDTLRARLCRPKPITVVPVKGWATSGPHPSLAENLARRTAELLDGDPGGPVGCFVNTVARAVDVFHALQDTRITGRSVTAVMVCGQVRPVDIALLEDRYPGLFTPDGNPEIDVIVSTQSLEVGVDLDLAGIVTELASGSALAQRAGRVNRRGRRRNGPVTVFVPDSPIRPDTRTGPYSPDELSAALGWLQRRAADPSGLTPWSLRDDPPPPARLRRTLLQRPELGQVWHWARTSDDLAAEADLDLWLSDDLEPNSSVGLVVRRDLPDDIDDAIELIKLLPPRPHEIFPIPLRTARRALSDALARARVPNSRATLGAVLVRGDDVVPLDWAARDNSDGDAADENGDNIGRAGNQPWPRIRPGDLVVLDATTPLFTASTIGDHRTPPVLVTDDQTRPCPADDVLEATALLDRTLRAGEVVHRIELNVELSKQAALVGSLALPPDSETEPLDERTIVRDWLDTATDTDAANPMARAAAALLHTATDRQVDVVVQRDSEDTPVRVVIIDGRRVFADGDVRQEWTPSSKPVTLAQHQADVADRVVMLAQRVGLPDDLRAGLRKAALHHDDGKADDRFQVWLGSSRPPVLAKSHDLATPETIRRRLNRSGLPPQWRHEQRSVVDAWPLIPPGQDHDLIARLIGTTHGRGRSWFPHTAAELLAPGDSPTTHDIASMLFDEGGWDELIEHTQLHYGVWGCAYLEALLRAADGQISAEGR